MAVVPRLMVLVEVATARAGSGVAVDQVSAFRAGVDIILVVVIEIIIDVVVIIVIQIVIVVVSHRWYFVRRTSLLVDEIFT